MKTIAIIPAGGKGLRAGNTLKGTATPKQYLKINGKELIVYTLQTFQKSKLIDKIIVAAEPEYFDMLIKLVKKVQTHQTKTYC